MPVSQPRPEMAAAATFVAGLEKFVLELFERLWADRPGDELAAINTTYALAVRLSTRVLLRVAAEDRELVPRLRENQDAPTNAASWPAHCRVGLDTGLDELFGPLPPLSKDVRWTRNLFERMRACLEPTASPALIGVSYEHLQEFRPKRDKVGWSLQASNKRRSKGAFFTPPSLTRHLCEATLTTLLKKYPGTVGLLSLRVVDPSVGAGFFLQKALEQLAGELQRRDPQIGAPAARRAVLSECLYGVDLDPNAVALSRALLWLAVGDPQLSPACAAPHLVTGDALLGPNPTSAQPDAKAGHQGTFSWKIDFAAVFDDATARGRTGFDAIVSNPPWARLRPERKAFLAQFRAGLMELQGPRFENAADRLASEKGELEDAWQEFKLDRVGYARALKASGAYPFQAVQVNGKRTGGDADSYKFFLERATHLLQPAGRLGVVVPAALLQSSGATGLRRMLLTSGRIEQLFVLENRAGYFPIHKMFRFALLVWQAGGEPGIGEFGYESAPPKKNDVRTLRLPKERVTLDLPWIKAVSGERLTIPLLRGRRATRLFKRMAGAHPRLGSPSSGWAIDFVREVDMSRNSQFFRTAAELEEAQWTPVAGGWESPDGTEAVPLYEGRLVNQHDHVAKLYLSGSSRKAIWRALDLKEKRLGPHFFLPLDSLKKPIPGLDLPRAGFCDISGHANERTALAALVPAGLPCGNKVPTLRFADPDPRLPLLWLAIANSFVIDWYLRRLVDTTINFFHWQQIPFPCPSPDSPVGIRLWAAAAQLAQLEGSHESHLASLAERWPQQFSSHLGPPSQQERALLRALIDAEVALLFKLSPTDLSFVLEDFPLLDRNQPEEKDRRPTRDLALWALHQRMGEGQSEETALLKDRVISALESGAIAYVPSELAKALQVRSPARPSPSENVLNLIASEAKGQTS